MGSSHSTPVAPVEFDHHLVSALADNAAIPVPSPARQSTIDAQIHARIQAELQRLREDEATVRDEMHAALEKENLDRERALAHDQDSAASSATLLADLDQVRAKVDRFHARRDLSQLPALREARDGLVVCYKNNTTTPLDCWQQVETFRASVSELEKQHIQSLQ
uniref:DUF1690-domain-containing protein n=1 Tax=Mycena chlorophos TaxID=658473 RepID=A0ABQ0M3Y0_MYCCL|nr:predicted protein [Mycena chlorophos]